MNNQSQTLYERLAQQQRHAAAEEQALLHQQSAPKACRKRPGVISRMMNTLMETCNRWIKGTQPEFAYTHTTLEIPQVNL